MTLEEEIENELKKKNIWYFKPRTKSDFPLNFPEGTGLKFKKYYPNTGKFPDFLVFDNKYIYIEVFGMGISSYINGKNEKIEILNDNNIQYFFIDEKAKKLYIKSDKKGESIRLPKSSQKIIEILKKEFPSLSKPKFINLNSFYSRNLTFFFEFF